jgi:hypothetical protein
MNSERRQHLVNEVRRLDAGMRRLADLAIDLHRLARELMADLRARRDKMRRQHDTLEATQREADRLLLADLLDLYINGGDADREWLRNLLDECRTFRWGFGWGLGMRIAIADEARKALAVFSMRDGGSDYRDEIMALDHIQNRIVLTASCTVWPGRSDAVRVSRCSPSPGRGSRIHRATAGNAIARVSRPRAV